MTVLGRLREVANGVPSCFEGPRHKSRSIFGEAYSARIDPAHQSSNHQRSKVIDHRQGRGVGGVKPKLH